MIASVHEELFNTAPFWQLGYVPECPQQQQQDQARQNQAKDSLNQKDYRANCFLAWGVLVSGVRTHAIPAKFVLALTTSHMRTPSIFLYPDATVWAQFSEHHSLQIVFKPF